MSKVKHCFRVFSIRRSKGVVRYVLSSIGPRFRQNQTWQCLTFLSPFIRHSTFMMTGCWATSEQQNPSWTAEREEILAKSGRAPRPGTTARESPRDCRQLQSTRPPMRVQHSPNIIKISFEVQDTKTMVLLKNQRTYWIDFKDCKSPFWTRGKACVLKTSSFRS